MNKRYGICAVAMLGMTSIPATAEIRFNGFASVVGGMTLDDEETYLGYDDDIGFDPDTLFALQATSDLGEGLSATVQMLARGNDDYDVELEWGYLSYDINDEWRINAGKLRTPFFKYSDYLDVGYAYYWIRPPEAVYNIPIQTFTGASVLYTTTLGDWDSVLQFSGGRNSGDDLAVGEETANIEANNILGVSWELTYDWFSARAVYVGAELDISTPAVDGAIAGIRQAGLGALASQLDAVEEDSSFIGFGISIDKNNVLFNAEWTEIELDESFVGDQTSWYASLGYRVGKWTPHVTYERIDDTARNEVLALAPTPELQGLTTQLLGALVEESDSLTVGVRYDFHSSAALKVEYTSFNDDLNSLNDADLVAFGVDIIF